MTRYCKWGKIRWAKLSLFSRFSGIPRKFFHEYTCLLLIIVNNEYLWPRQRENISAKTLMTLKSRVYSPVNLSPSTVISSIDPKLLPYYTSLFLLQNCHFETFIHYRKLFIDHYTMIYQYINALILNLHTLKHYASQYCSISSTYVY